MDYKMLHNVYGGFKEGMRLFDIAPTIRTPAGGGHHPFVLAIPRSTNTQLKSTTGDSMATKTTETQQQLIPGTSQTSTSSLEAFLARLSALPDDAPDLTTPEGLYFLRSLGFSETKDPDILCSKTSKVYLVTTAAKLSRQYLGFLPSWGTEWNGRYLTAKTTASRKTGSGCTLSDTLETNADERYYLSAEQTAAILGKHNLKLPTP